MEFDSAKIEKLKKIFITKQEFEYEINRIRESIRYEYEQEITRLKREVASAVNSLSNSKLDKDWLQSGRGIKYTISQGVERGSGGIEEIRLFNPKTRDDIQIN